jgi:hypothetical protein
MITEWDIYRLREEAEELPEDTPMNLIHRKYNQSYTQVKPEQETNIGWEHSYGEREERLYEQPETD